MAVFIVTSIFKVVLGINSRFTGVGGLEGGFGGVNAGRWVGFKVGNRLFCFELPIFTVCSAICIVGDEAVVVDGLGFEVRPVPR